MRCIRSIWKQSNQLILSNLKFISDHGARIYIRIPVIGGVNDNEEEMNAILSYLKEENIAVAQVNLLPYHDIAEAANINDWMKRIKARSSTFRAKSIWKLYKQNFNNMDSKTQK